MNQGLYGFPLPFSPPTNGVAPVQSQSISADVSLTTASFPYQVITSSVLGKSVFLPDATALTTGGPRFIIKNAGTYPIGIRDSSGTSLMSVAGGGIAYVTLETNTTAAGTWSVEGNNLEPALTTIDSTFSSTYTNTVFLPYVALDSNTSIHFVGLAANGFAAFVADNVGKVLSTPVTVDTTASSVPKQCFKIDATHAIVFYVSTGNILRGVVLTLTGSTPSYSLSVGTPSNSGSNTGIIVEDMIGEPKIAQLDTNLFLVSWATATGAGNTSVMGIQVSGSTTVNFGSKADIIVANNVINSTQTYKLTTTTAAVLYKSGAAAPYDNSAVVVSVTNANPPVCTVATPAAATNCQSSQTAACSSALLSATKLAIADDHNTTQVTVSGFTFSGTTTTAWTASNVETGLSTNLIEFTTNSATRYNPHLWLVSAGGTNTFGCWYFDSSSVSRTLVLSESAGTLTLGTKVYKNISNASAASTSGGFGAILPQGTTEFVSLRQTGAATGVGLGLQVVPNKINGSTITYGAGISLRDVSPASPAQFNFSKLTSGDYLILHVGSVNNYGQVRGQVIRTNGDYFNNRGSFSLPELAYNASGTTPIPIPAVASNRFAILGSTASGTTVGTTTYQLRFIMAEIAA